MYKKLAGILVFTIVFILGTVVTLASNEDQDTSLDSEEILSESSTTTEAAISSTSSSAISIEGEEKDTSSEEPIEDLLPEEDMYIENQNEDEENPDEELTVAQKATEKYAEIFFDPEIKSETEFLVDIEIKKDPESSDIVTHVVSGTVNNTDELIELENSTIVLMMYYVDEEGVYRELYRVDGEAKNVLEEVLLFYSKIELEIGDNSLRMIAFKKSEWEQLQLEKNLQISDYQVNVKDMSFMDKVENTIKAIFEFQKDLLENR